MINLLYTPYPLPLTIYYIGTAVAYFSDQKYAGMCILPLGDRGRALRSVLIWQD